MSTGHGLDRWDEVWDGVPVVAPIADMDHQWLANGFSSFLAYLISWQGLGRVCEGCNVSDRDDWTKQYRVPDVAVFLKSSESRLRETHTVGGPDFLIEILSDDDSALEKLPFYAKVGVSEALYVHREPWALELYRLEAGELRPVSRVTVDDDHSIHCESVPLEIALVRSEDGGRPRIRLSARGQALTRDF